MNPAQPLRILGIDPGTRHVGYCVLEQRGFELRRLASGCIKAGDGDIAGRLAAIHRGLTAVIAKHSPSAAAVETVFTSRNPKSAIAIGEGRGVAVLSAAQYGLEVKGYEPTLVKKAVAGNGRAGKEQVRRMVRVLLRLDAAPATDHESDAIAIAITHAMHCRQARPTDSGRKTLLDGLRKKSLPDFVLRQLPAGATPANRAARSGRR
ncbi:MAG: crossover junction endodeoxyribonuclease RuvC [Planctomycetota bacterium]|jgi:crossover junction endodeoxyribonuclease RuvC|nr:crossover junction endodeoxyribonuclease RuvC [Planctomycetota bacterium]